MAWVVLHIGLAMVDSNIDSDTDFEIDLVVAGLHFDIGFDPGIEMVSLRLEVALDTASAWADLSIASV
jgi:hypothetical protein